MNFNCLKNTTTTPWSDWACCLGHSIDEKKELSNISITPIIGAIVCLALAVFALIAKLLVVFELAKVRHSKSEFAIENNYVSKKAYYGTVVHYITNLFIVPVAGATFAMTLNQPMCCPEWVTEDYLTCQHCVG